MYTRSNDPSFVKRCDAAERSYTTFTGLSVQWTSWCSQTRTQNGTRNVFQIKHFKISSMLIPIFALVCVNEGVSLHGTQPAETRLPGTTFCSEGPLIRRLIG